MTLVAPTGRVTLWNSQTFLIHDRVKPRQNAKNQLENRDIDTRPGFAGDPLAQVTRPYRTPYSGRRSVLQLQLAGCFRRMQAGAAS